MNRFSCAKNIFRVAQNLANLVVPLEYGITQKEKLAIAQGIASPLLRKIRADLLHVKESACEKENDPENVNRLHPRYEHINLTGTYKFQCEVLRSIIGSRKMWLHQIG